MENIENVERERAFVKSGSDSGFGSGSASGNGAWTGHGSGDGRCLEHNEFNRRSYSAYPVLGYGCGRGETDGSGSGFADPAYLHTNMKSFNGNTVYVIDGTPTILKRIKGNVAKGYILHYDFTLTPCYVVKQDRYYAHGSTLHEAMASLREKLYDATPISERIAQFVASHKPGELYSDEDLYSWHHILTGSCEAGRKAFMKDHGIDSLNGFRTVEDFIALTESAYGGDIIRELKKHYIKGE